MSNIWVVTSNAEVADSFAGSVAADPTSITVVAVGSTEAAEAAARRGVGRVISIVLADGSPVEAVASEVADLVLRATPELVFGGVSASDRVLLGAIAGRAGVSIISAVTGFPSEGSFTREILGGIVATTERATGMVVVSMIPVRATESVTGAAATAIETQDLAAAMAHVVDLRPTETSAVNLTNASRIVSVGRGLKSADDLSMINDLAAALHAEVSCSRPLAEGLGWLPKDRYVGISGNQVTPDLYVAIGISGQLQHLVGCRRSATIVAINNDEKAPIFSSCDYGVVGDLYSVVPALTKALTA
jgi:electron transfer flavoprotein alpha subunit